eukprot:SAG31_NODE_4919_length_2868_cov_1.265800_3_plen_112_part_00
MTLLIYFKSPRLSTHITFIQLAFAAFVYVLLHFARKSPVYRLLIQRCILWYSLTSWPGLQMICPYAASVHFSTLTHGELMPLNGVGTPCSRNVVAFKAGGCVCGYEQLCFF